MMPGSFLKAFYEWRDLRQPLVLASVFETEGSTYSKTGARMIINSQGDFQGMLSGGCLEGDLAERARAVAIPVPRSALGKSRHCLIPASMAKN